MAGGPVQPKSVFFETIDKVFPFLFVGDGAGGFDTEEGIGVLASLDADAIVQLKFEMPIGTLPSGTGKLRLIAQADAVSGSAKVNPKWASVAVGEDPSSATLNAEGTGTITWSTNDDDEYQELKINLDAVALVAGEFVVMNLTFETSSWTLAVISKWEASIIWE